MILEITFSVWFFLVVLIVAFIRGSSLKRPPSGRVAARPELQDKDRSGLQAWSNRGGDVR
jgi:hypothetical protein